MLEIFLIMTLGFLGSFGHCVGMCGPLTVAFSLSLKSENSGWAQLYFHILLNVGRILSYALVGAALGGVGSIVIASGQLGGVGSQLRQAIAILTGILLIWFGLIQIKPNWLPVLPILHPLTNKTLHQRLFGAMNQVSKNFNWWTPFLLGSIWGLVPCGFLYAAQIKAAETGNLWLGAITMLAFGVGTMPMMLTVGVGASRLSADKRSQLFRLGGWVTITIGILTIFRTDAMIDYTGHGALLLLMLALIARPVSGLWNGLLVYRRALGVGAFVLSLAHTAHMLDHTLQWNWQAVLFMLPQYQVGIIGGFIALVLMTPAAVTSFDTLQKALGRYWRKIHLLTIPSLVLATIHTILIGSHYWGDLQANWANQWRVAIAILLMLLVLLIRWRYFWVICGLDRFYHAAKN